MTDVAVRKFGFFYENPDRTVDFSISPIVVAGDVAAEFERLIQPLFEFFPIAIAIEVCERDLLTLQSVPVRLADLWQVSSQSSTHDLNVVEFLVEAVRNVNALLSAASAFLGQTEKALAAATYVSHKEVAAWNLFRQGVHARSPAYRIMYQLRNFAQHYALPISRTGMTLNRFSESDRHATGFHIWLDRDKLLNSGFGWGKVAEDIMSQDAEFDVAVLLFEHITSMRELFLDVARLYEPNREELRMYFTKLRELIGAPLGSHLMIFERRAGDTGQPPKNAEIVPEAQLLWVDSLVERTGDPTRARAAT